MGEQYYIYRDGQKFQGPLTEEQASHFMATVATRALEETGMGTLLGSVFLEYAGQRIAHVWEMVPEGGKPRGKNIRESLNALLARMEEVRNAEEEVQDD